MFSKESNNQSKFKPSDVRGQINIEAELVSPLPPPVIETPIEPAIILPPAYFYLKISTVRDIQAPMPALTYLSFRPFKGDDRIETRPISYHDEFDSTTGHLLPLPSFDYSLTRPMTQSHLKSISCPIIIEVYLIGPDASKKLVGLVRIPFQVLVSAFDGETIVHSPLSDYVIVDPLSGESAGWVSATMALGMWKDVEPLVSSLHSEKEIQEKLILEPNVDGQLVAQDVDLEVLHQEEELLNPLNQNVPLKTTTTSAESVLQVTIHRACGLYQLLEQLEPTEQVNIALDRGPNIFITLELFPSDEDPDPIQTQVVVYSFTPSFEYSLQVTVECLDTDLIRWIKDGGSARGSIFHRIPRHLVTDGIESLHLGDFSVPLLDLLGGGIDREWFLVQGRGGGGGLDCGAVECSLTFDGFDLGGLGRGTGGGGSVSDTVLEIHVRGVCIEGVAETGLSINWTPSGSSETIQHVLQVGGFKMEQSIDPSLSKLELIVYSDDGSLIGCASCKLEQFIRQARVNSRLAKSGKAAENVLVHKTLPIINPDNAEWMDAVVDVSFQIKIERKTRKKKAIVDDSMHISERYSGFVSSIFDLLVLLPKSHGLNQ